MISPIRAPIKKYCTVIKTGKTNGCISYVLGVEAKDTGIVAIKTPQQKGVSEQLNANIDIRIPSKEKIIPPFCQYFNLFQNFFGFILSTT